MSSGLDEPVLILNKSWLAIDACTARDALVSAFCERAQIICPDTFRPLDILEWISLPVTEGQKFILGTRSKIRVPEVIVSTYDKIPRPRVVFSRRNLWKRDNYQCQYCGKKPKSDDITIDHIIPRSKGGKSTFANCVLACITCNTKKNNRTPEQAGMKLCRFVKNTHGVIHQHYYDKPKTPVWSPIYAMKRYQKPPKSWSNFIQHMIDELYWNLELEPD